MLTDNTYKLTLKGKNGEPFQHKEVNLDFQIKGTRQREKFKFYTDQKGVVSLGNLCAVRAVSYV